MGLKITTEYLFLIAIVSLCEIVPCTPKISDKRLCYDAECTVPISQAKTVTVYHSRDKDVLSFPLNVDVTVYSKEAGDRKDLWGVEIQGRRGYAPKSFIREKKVFHKLQHLHEVPTERIPSENTSKDHKTDEKVPPGFIDSSIEAGSPSPITPQVSPSFEVVDGTTIHFSTDDIREEESYATKIRHSPGSIDEQPILSVHPNIASSEVHLKEKLSSATGDLPLKTEEEQNQDETEEKVPRDEDIVDTEQKAVDEPNENNEEVPESSLDNEIKDDSLELGMKTSQDERGEEGKDDSVPDKEETSEENGAEQPQHYLFSAFESVTSIFDSLSTTEAPGATETDEGGSPEAVTTPEVIPGTMPVTERSVPESVEKTTEKVEGKNYSERVSPPEEIPETISATDNVDVEKNPEVIQNSTETPLTGHINSETITVSENANSKKIPETIEEKNSPKIVSTPPTIPETTPVTEKVFTEKTPDLVDAENSSGAALPPETIPDGIPEATGTESTPESIIPDQKFEGNLFITEASKDIEMINSSSSGSAPEIDETVTEGNETAPESVDKPLGDDKNVIQGDGQPGIYRKDELSGPTQSIDDNNVLDFNGFQNRNLLNVETDRSRRENSGKISLKPPQATHDPLPPVIPVDQPVVAHPESSTVAPELTTETAVEQSESTIELSSPVTPETLQDHLYQPQETLPPTPALENTPTTLEEHLIPSKQCDALGDCPNFQEETPSEKQEDEEFFGTAMGSAIKFGRNYWEALSYVALTAFTTLLFSLGYYYIENRRRDGEFIAKINRLEKELLVASKECSAMDETLKSTKNKLTSIEDESFGSNEMVLSLKNELDNAHKAKSELEDQVSALERDLEGATEAGLELERMLREILATNSAENPLAKSVEDLQARLNAQQAVNESLTNALHLKTQESETLSRDLTLTTQKCEQLEVEIVRMTGELKEEKELRINIEGMLSKKIEDVEKQHKDMSAERLILRKQLKGKEMELNDLLEVVKQSNTHSIDFDKLADVSHIKAEAIQLTEERDELKIKLSEVEGAHHLLDEHMKVINEEVTALSEQCKLAEKEKREAETRLEVLSNFFKEKEAERQKEEAAWLQQQGEVSTTVERLQTMHNEILSYKQQIESLKREILDQEKEYKAQITNLEAKAHEQWVLARQNERRLEESKSEAAQLRNRLTIIEKNLTETESDVKLHRMETNGDPGTSPLFLGAEASSSPIMFSGTTGPPPPPPSYLYGPPLPYLPPPLPPPLGLAPYDVSQRPPPLGGRLASPPPMPPLLPPSSRYDGPGSLSPPPHSPPLLPPYNPRNYPGPFGNERIPPPLPPPWADEPLPPARNTAFHSFHRDHRTRDKGSLHSSRESLDKSHHSGKV
ncbi:transport and Golgi organization protein 1 isoform X2 [Diachasmimorpha longicaudata]|uniref:transport and Golgi organization protein 1 isoform X2 n=1 Tax=Diachasmimorpha longicaudata TaxID=58733 RepID=UPI0030B8CB88